MVNASRHFSSCRAFTLLEVLVAMTIVGLGVATLLQIFSQGLQLHTRSTVKSEAIIRGARLLDEMLARNELPDGSDNGSFGAGGRWTAEIQTVRDEPSSLNLGNRWELKEITLRLLIDDGGRERRTELKTLRLVRKGP